MTSTYANHDDSYCLLSTSFNLKISSLISPHLIGLLFNSKFTQELTLLNYLNYLEFKKTEQELGDLLGSKNPTRGKLTLTAAPNYSTKMI